MLPQEFLKSTLSEMLFSPHLFMKFFFKIQYRLSVKRQDFFLCFQHFLYPLLGRVPDWHQVDGYPKFSYCCFTPPSPPSCSLASNGWFPISNSCKYRAASRLSNSVAAANCRTLLWPERKRHLLISPVNRMDVLKKDQEP